MEIRNNHYDNMGPRLDLGPAPQTPPRSRAELAPAPFQRPQPPEDKSPDREQISHTGPNAPGQVPNQAAAPEKTNNFFSPPAGRERAWQETNFDNLGAERPEAEKAPGGIMLTKPGPSRWLNWAALALAAAALAYSLLGSGIQTVNPETINSEAVPGATAERVAKLERDVGSLMLKTVTLEKDLEAIKNRSWSPARLNEISSRLNALQAQLDTLISAAGAPAAARNTPAPPPATASERIEDRAGAKPAAASADAANPANGQNRPRAAAPSPHPRATYTVQRGDTLFSVAQRYQVTTRELMEWNQIKPEDKLATGKNLIIY